MKRYYIKKSILARNIREAIRKEKESDICDIFEDTMYVDETAQLTIGFNNNKRHEKTKPIPTAKLKVSKKARRTIGA